ncbi:hypothetical protein P9112_009883 [Eukaryota sp. TZLM1-RC]
MILTCSICHETMHEPCSLTCGHSFCLNKCLRPWFEKSQTCPECRRPAERKSLHVNISLREAIEHMSLSPPRCERCEEAPAAVVCHDCTSSLCQSCTGIVHSMGVFRSHTVVPLHESPLLPKKCTKHKTKPLEYFCQQCSIPVCVNCCLVDGHSSHGDMLPLDEALDSYTTTITTINNDLEQCLCQAKEVASEATSQLSRSIGDCLESLKSCIDSCKVPSSTDVFFSGNPVTLNQTAPCLKNEIKGCFSDAKDNISRIEGKFLEIAKIIMNVVDSTKFGEPKTTSNVAQSFGGVVFSKEFKHDKVFVSDNGLVAESGGGGGYQQIRGDKPLKHGSVHKWRVRYQGDDGGFAIGVIAGKKFDSSRFNHSDVYGCHNGSGEPFNTSGTTSQWKQGDVIEITVDLVNYTINLKEVGSGYIDLNGELPRLDGDFYYPYFAFGYSSTQNVIVRHDHRLYIVE